MSIKPKKKYRKPQLTEVRLELQSPVLSNCASVYPYTQDVGVCSYPGALCPDPDA